MPTARINIFNYNSLQFHKRHLILPFIVDFQGKINYICLTNWQNDTASVFTITIEYFIKTKWHSPVDWRSYLLMHFIQSYLMATHKKNGVSISPSLSRGDREVLRLVSGHLTVMTLDPFFKISPTHYSTTPLSIYVARTYQYVPMLVKLARFCLLFQNLKIKWMARSRSERFMTRKPK